MLDLHLHTLDVPCYLVFDLLVETLVGDPEFLFKTVYFVYFAHVVFVLLVSNYLLQSLDVADQLPRILKAKVVDLAHHKGVELSKHLVEFFQARRGQH